MRVTLHANIRMQHLVVPELYCPFPARVNPHAALAHHHTLAWAQHFHLLPDNVPAATFAATNLGGLAARFHPEAAPEALELIADWYTWMFFHDDQRDESPLGRDPERLAAVDASFLAILKGTEPSSTAPPLAHALRDLRDRLHVRLPSATWFRRFSRTVQEHFDATVWEAMNRAHHRFPDLATYIRMRPLTGGMHVDTAFIAMAEHVHLPLEVFRHPVVHQLTTVSNNAVCWANDLISLPKEVERGDVHNLVVLLQRTEQLPLSQAITKAAAMHDHAVHTFLALEPRLPHVNSAVDANLQRYVNVLRARMRGNIDWALASKRYRPTPPINSSVEEE